MSYQITSREGTYEGEAEILDIFEATDGDQVIGALYITKDTTEVAQVEVIPARRREGIATALWEQATTELGEIFHAYEAHRTTEGQAFAEAVGGDEIEECSIAVCFCSELAA